MDIINYNKETDCLTYADNGEEIKNLAILYDNKNGIIQKYGDVEDVERYHESCPTLIKNWHSIATFDNLSKGDAAIACEYFMTHTSGKQFLDFLNAGAKEQNTLIQHMAELMEINRDDYSMTLVDKENMQAMSSKDQYLFATMLDTKT